jgi:O-antigen/teichoic acid export membrane protein
LHRALELMNKVQILAVVPAGFGLAVMVADYLPLLYGHSFVQAVPVARLLVALLYAETALAVAPLVLWVDERHGSVLAAQLAMVAGAPLFIWAAGQWGVLGAAVVLGGSRALSSVIGYVAARRIYGMRYPWGFAARVGAVSSTMAATLVLLQRWWGTSIWEAFTLTLAGIVLVLLGLRWCRVMGPAEVELLDRTSIPGRHFLIRWLSR